MVTPSGGNSDEVNFLWVVISEGKQSSKVNKNVAILKKILYSSYINTHSINYTPPLTVPELLHCPIHSPQTSQIQFLEEASTCECIGAIP